MTVVSLVGLYFLTDASDLWPFEVLSLVLGFGVGMFNQPLTLAMQNILPPEDMGVSTAAVTFFRQLGGTLGLAFFLSLFFAYVPTAIDHEVSAAAGRPAFHTAVVQAASEATDRDVRDVADGLRANDTAAVASVVGHDSDVIQALPAVVARPFRRAFADSMGLVFLTASGVSLVGLLLLVSWPPVPLRGAAGMREAARQDANATPPE